MILALNESLSPSLAYTFRQRHSREKERRLQWNLEEKEFGSISFVDAFVRNLASNEDLLSWKNVGTLKSPLYKENIQFHVFCRISLSRSRGNIKSIFLHPSPLPSNRSAECLKSFGANVKRLNIRTGKKTLDLIYIFNFAPRFLKARDTNWN